MMHPEIKAQWIAALRSGDWKKMEFYFQDNSKGYLEACALGVLCGTTTNCPMRSADFILGIPMPTDICLAAGVPLAAINRIMSLNNEPSTTFDEIADWIEENL